MKIIIPMAGMGTRMRPHTLTVPKPLITLAGKTIVQRLVEGIAQICEEPIDEIAFVIGNFGEKVEKELFRKIKQQREAYFYWDFDKYYAQAAAATAMDMTIR